MKKEDVLKKIVFFTIILYFLDIILLGGGTLTRIGGVSTRMILFIITILASIPGILREYKKYLTNKYCISVVIFMLLVTVAFILGISNGNSRTIMMTDIKGFLNILIVFPIMYALDTKENIIALIKTMTVALIGIAFLTLILSFYMKMPLDMQSIVYEFFNKNVLCGITCLNQNVTRVFFHTAGRLFFIGFMFLLTYTVINPDKRFIKETGLALLICACFVSYTRSIYLGIFVCFVCFSIFVVFLFRNKVKQYFISIFHMSIMACVIVLLLGILQNDNLISVAVNRCLIATTESNTLQEKEEENISGLDIQEEESILSSDNNMMKNSGKDYSSEGKLDDIDAEKTNLEIRMLRKEMAVANIKRSPIIGNGLGVVNDINGEHIEYFYLDLLSKMGIVGILVFFTPFIMTILDLVKYRKKYSDETALLLFSSIIGVLFLLIISHFNPCMNTNVGLSVYCLSMCIASTLKKEEAKSIE